MKKKSISLLIFAFVLMITLCIVQIVVSSKLATAGTTLSKIDNSVQAYETENAILREKVYDNSSLTHIASSAAGMGFVEQKQPLALTGGLPIASR